MISFGMAAAGICLAASGKGAIVSCVRKNARHQPWVIGKTFPIMSVSYRKWIFLFTKSNPIHSLAQFPQGISE